MNEIYLDNSATTPLCEAARRAFLETSDTCFGNPSSLHSAGLRAAHALEEARLSVMRALGAREGQLVFTGSGSEANNLAIFGRAYAKARYRRGSRIITTAGEHASVTMPLARLSEEGYEVVTIPTRGGEIDRTALEAALTKNTILVSAMLVNNETGAHYDIPALAHLVHQMAPEALVHTDATQGFLKVPFSAARDGVDLITVSAHKIGGPKGCGALWIAGRVIQNKGITPRVLGGGQEHGLRSGTENVPGYAAFGAAAAEGVAHFTEHTEKMAARRAYLLEKLAKDPTFAEIRPNLPRQAAPHIISLTLPQIKSETMLHHLSSAGIYVSSGSACSSHGRHAGHPLVAFGLRESEADCAIRISLSPETTEAALDAFLSTLATGLERLVRMK